MSRDKKAYLDSITETLPLLIETDEFEAINSQITYLIQAISEQLRLPANPIILELGSGPGHLTRKLIDKLHPEKFLSVDFSEAMICDVKATFIDNHDVEFKCLDIAELERNAASYDIIASSFALHHLTNDERIILFKKCLTWLKPGGLFVNGDIYEEDDPQVQTLMTHCADLRLRQLSLSEDEMAIRVAHRKHEHRCSMEIQAKDLLAAGFSHVWCAHKQIDRGVLLAFTS